MSQLPIDTAVNLRLSTLGTEDMGDTPSSPAFVHATPNAEKNRLIINSTYLLATSFLLNFTTSLFKDNYIKA